MENTKIGNKEAIALLVTITFNQLIINGSKAILNTTASSSLLNILFISIIVIIFDCAICFFLNKFPAFDLIDISGYLGGNFLKWSVGLLYIVYFLLFSGNLLHLFSTCLQIIYFPVTLLVFIRLFLIIGTIIICLLKNNAIYRSTFVLFPILIISTLFLFISDIQFFDVENVYPMFGYGIFYTFVSGLSNLLIFQTLAYIFFLPPIMKNPSEIKKITITSIIISSLFILLTVATVLFTFNGLVEVDELLPLYSAVRYIDYGSFFQKMNSIFLLIWIMSFVSYLGITLKFSANILKKLSLFKTDSIFVIILGILLFLASGWQKSYAISTFFVQSALKFSFFILIFGISFLILAFAYLKYKYLKSKEQ